MTKKNEKIKDALLAVASNMKVISAALENIENKPCLACDISVVVDENIKKLLDVIGAIEE